MNYDQYNLFGDSFNPKDFSSLILPQVKSDDNELVRADLKAYSEYANQLKEYSYINSFIDQMYLQQDKKEDEADRTKIANDWANSLSTTPQDSDQMASEDIVRSRRLNATGPLVYRDYQTGQLLFGDPDRNEQQWIISQSKDNIEGIFGFEKPAAAQASLRYMGEAYNREDFYSALQKAGMSLDETQREVAVNRLKEFAAWSEWGWGANWAQFIPFLSPDSRDNLTRETLKALTLGGSGGLTAFGENYYSSDPTDIVANLPQNPNWNYNKAWEAFQETNPGAAAWFVQSGLDVQSLSNTKNELDFFYELNEFVDRNAFIRIMGSDIEQMSDLGYTFKTTVMPLVRDSFGSIDAPIDIAATIGLAVATSGVGGVALVGTRSAILAGQYGSKAQKALMAVQKFRKATEVVTSWLPHNVAGKFAKDATTFTGKASRYAGVSIGNGVITGAWYNINNQLNNMDNDESYRWSTENLGKDIAMEIIGEFGLGGLSSGVQFVSFKGVSALNAKSNNYLGKLAKSQFEKLPTNLQEFLKASSQLARPFGTNEDISNYELRVYTDAVVTAYAMRTAGIIDANNQAPNFRTAAAWGMASQTLSAERTAKIVEKAKGEFKRKKQELQEAGSTEVLSDDDMDLYVAETLFSAMVSDTSLSEAGKQQVVSLWIAMEQEMFNKSQRKEPEVNAKKKEISDLEDQKMNLVEYLEKNKTKLTEEQKKETQDKIDGLSAELNTKNIELETLNRSIDITSMTAEQLATMLKEWRDGKRKRSRELLALISPSESLSAMESVLSREEMQAAAVELGPEVIPLIETLRETSAPEAGVPVDLGSTLATEMDTAAAKAARIAPPAPPEVAPAAPEVAPAAAPAAPEVAPEAAPAAPEAAPEVAEPTPEPSTGDIDVRSTITELATKLESVDRIYLFNRILQKFKDACK